MAMVDLYKTLKKQVFKLFMEERERRRTALRLRFEVQKKSFDKKGNMH
ncbi:MAG: hypothetical protein WKI49_06645 [Aquificaceae bacterium]